MLYILYIFYILYICIFNIHIGHIFMHGTWQALGVHVSSLSEPMNAIIFAQVGVEPK